MRFLFLIVAVVLVFPLRSSEAANCPTGGTTIVYGNGVDTTWNDAMASRDLLEEKIRAQLAGTVAVDQSCLLFLLAYDPAIIDGNSAVAHIINIAVQVNLVASVQVARQFLPRFVQWLADPSSGPVWFQFGLATVIRTAQSIDRAVLNTHLALYDNEFYVLGNDKVIVVAHSQGNLYVNQAHVELGTPGDDSFGVVGVATPASSVAGGGPHVTLENDIITLVPGHLPSNTTNFPLPGEPCSSAIVIASRLDCHAFATSYLPGVNSGSAIADQVVFGIPVPVRVEKTGPGSGRVLSNMPGIDLTCDPNCAATTATFPLLTFGNNTALTLSAIPEPGSRVAGWSGWCADIGLINGNELTFSITLSVNIPSFPQDCVVEFEEAADVAVRLNPFDAQTSGGPYRIEVVTSAQEPTNAPGEITVTLLREVISQCRGLLFSSPRTVTVPVGQAFGTFGFNAGHDPFCSAVPITTQYTVVGALLTQAGVSSPIDLSDVPAERLFLSVFR